jgi:hypothetical protein
MRDGKTKKPQNVVRRQQNVYNGNRKVLLIAADVQFLVKGADI